MPTPAEFESYFHKRADLAEELYASSTGNRTAAKLMAVVALDALGAIWKHDYAATTSTTTFLLAEFVQTFVPDKRSDWIAVVFLAEDLIRMGPPRLAPVAKKLLQERDADPCPPNEFPHSHKDKNWADLVVEEPSFANEAALEKLAKRYTYPALLYSLLRCSVAHSFTTGSRVSDYSPMEGDDDISYSAPELFAGQRKPICIKFGIRTITGWLRAAATNYAAKCAADGKQPAEGYDANKQSFQKLEELWKKATW
jgi:hypothetical protein